MLRNLKSAASCANGDNGSSCADQANGAPRLRIIHDNAVYSLAEAQHLLDLRPHTLAREVRLRRLRVCRRGGRYFFLGDWLMQWLRDGEVKHV